MQVRKRLGVAHAKKKKRNGRQLRLLIKLRNAQMQNAEEPG